MFNDPVIDGHENQADAEIQEEADSGRPQLNPEQITRFRLANDPGIKATVEANKAQAQARRESELMLLGYNQALLDYGNLPNGWETQTMINTINDQKVKLGIE